MINKNEFVEIRKDLKDFEEKREETIRKSRDIIMLSKQIIYSTQRNELKKAEELCKEIRKLVKELPSGNYDTDMETVAVQEYVEAVCFYEFVKNKKLLTRKELGVITGDYLLGLCDLTGELVRQAVNAVINKKYDEAIEIKEFVSEIYGEFLQFDLRGGQLRKKADSIKWNLRKLEDLALGISIRSPVELRQETD
jgi:translin